MEWITRRIDRFWREALSAMAVLLVVPIGYLIFSTYEENHIASQALHIKSLSQHVASALAKDMQVRQLEVRALAELPEIKSGPLNSEKVQLALIQAQNSYPLYSWIGVADIKGKVHAATKGMLLGQSVSSRPWFEQALSRPYTGDLHEAKLLADLLNAPLADGPLRFIDFAAPIRDAQGNTRGVIGAHVYWRWADNLVGSFLSNSYMRDQIEIWLLNRDNEIIFPNNFRQPFDVKYLAMIERSPSAQFIRWAGKEPYLSASTRLQAPGHEISNLGWRVVVTQPKSAVIQMVAPVTNTVRFLMFLPILIFVLVVWWLSKQRTHSSPA